MSRLEFSIDSNDAEPLIKQLATGRKNWLFIGSIESNNAATGLTERGGAEQSEEPPRYRKHDMAVVYAHLRQGLFIAPDPQMVSLNMN